MCDVNNQLVLKSTFLSVQTRPAASRDRARSAPPPHGHSGSAGKQADYVAGLVQRAAELGFPQADTDNGQVGQMATDEADRTMTNPGTLGHPQLCCRPCVYLAIAGSCRNGASCEYCHEGHAGRVPKLDKQQRQLFHALSEADTLGLLLPYLADKAISMPPAAAELVHHLERYLAALNSTTGTVISHARLAKLAHVLQNMSFIRVLCLMPTIWSDELKALLAKLRHEYHAVPQQRQLE
ncbi:unnamed protein product [Symbiodinium pilosum]|uniref:C3H1-type domain-containing protein n=1 Tax=Symbiodinium pilosum TaxID=2952 RepID=A0A812JK25_SYMPI|nr:unnamed protein product [Symbiodinium pilosum]